MTKNAHNYFSIFIIVMIFGCVGNAMAGKIYKRVDNNGNIYYTDKAETVKEAEEQADVARQRRNQAKIDKLNRKFHYRGDEKYTQKKIDNIILNYQQRKQAVENLEKQRETNCGKEPTEKSWFGFGEVRDRYMAWQNCTRQYELELRKKKKQLRTAERQYRIIK